MDVSSACAYRGSLAYLTISESVKYENTAQSIFLNIPLTVLQIILILVNFSTVLVLFVLNYHEYTDFLRSTLFTPSIVFHGH